MENTLLTSIVLTIALIALYAFGNFLFFAKVLKKELARNHQTPQFNALFQVFVWNAMVILSLCGLTIIFMVVFGIVTTIMEATGI